MNVVRKTLLFVEDNRINPPKSGAYHEMLMKNRNENQPFEMISREVTRIIFGDENLAEMPLRLTRIALERYHVPEIILGLPGANGQDGSPAEPASCRRV